MCGSALPAIHAGFAPGPSRLQSPVRARAHKHYVCWRNWVRLAPFSTVHWAHTMFWTTFWTIYYCVLAVLKVIFKALTVMGLAGLGTGALAQGLKGEKDPLAAGVGAFLMAGALILFLAWYWPR